MVFPPPPTPPPCVHHTHEGVSYSLIKTYKLFPCELFRVVRAPHKTILRPRGNYFSFAITSAIRGTEIINKAFNEAEHKQSVRSEEAGRFHVGLSACLASAGGGHQAVHRSVIAELGAWGACLDRAFFTAIRATVTFKEYLPGAIRLLLFLAHWRPHRLSV